MDLEKLFNAICGIIGIVLIGMLIPEILVNMAAIGSFTMMVLFLLVSMTVEDADPERVMQVHSVTSFASAYWCFIAVAKTQAAMASLGLTLSTGVLTCMVFGLLIHYFSTRQTAY